MWLILILLLSAVLRFFWLNLFPTSVTGDELTYILSAKSFLLTGSDLSGALPWWQILLFQYPPTVLPQAELPYFLLLPFVNGDFSLFLIRLPFAVLGILLVWLVYAVAKEFFTRPVALFAAFFTAISPWLIYINRTAYEMTPALVFYLAGLLVLLKTKSWKIFFAFPFFILAFYSYIATKVVFLPFIFLTLLFLFLIKNKRRYLKQYSMFAILSVVFVGLFIVLLQHNGSSRMSEFLLPTSDVVSQQVDSLRRTSLATPLTDLFINKMTVYFSMVLNRFYLFVSGTYLFTAGDGFFGMWHHGVFYAVDMIFLLLGLYFLARKERFVFLYFVGILFIGLLPQLLHQGSDNSTPHLTFIFPFFLMIIAYGVTSVISLWKRYQKLFLMIIVAIYGVFLANFLFIYFYQYPIRGQSDFSSRLLAGYLALHNRDTSVVVHSERSSDLLKKYIFYQSLYTRETALPLRLQLRELSPQIANVIFKPCDESINPEEIDAVVIVASSCQSLQTDQQSIVIGQALDSGSTYRIYNDRVCRYPLKRYIADLTVSDFAVESLPQKKFCQTFILSQ